MNTPRPPYDPLDQALARKLRDHAPKGAHGQTPSWDEFRSRAAQTAGAAGAVGAVTAAKRKLGRWIKISATSAAAMAAAVVVGGYVLGWYDRVEMQAVQLAYSAMEFEKAAEPNPPTVLASATPHRTVRPVSLLDVEPIDRPAETPTADAEEVPVQTADKPSATPKTEQKRNDRRSSGAFVPSDDLTPVKKPADRKLRIGAYAALGSSSGASGSRASNAEVVTADYTVGKYTGQMGFERGELKHDFPVSVGLSLDIPLVPRLRLSTGLLYTYVHSSAATVSGFDYRYDYRTHYLGVPVAVSYDFLVSRPVDLYVTGGAAAEWAVASAARAEVYSTTGELLTSKSESIDAQGAMVSFNLGVGVNVRLSPRVGLYAEPGVTTYLPNDSHPINFRTSEPVQFSVRAGIRVKL